MSSDPPKGDPPKDGEQPPNSKKLHIWGKPLEQQPPAGQQQGDGDKPPRAGNDFQRNFPEANGGGLSEAVKSIKPGDFLEVHKTACGRSGFMFGIVAGAALGGIRFVWRGVPKSAANWAVGGFLTGATLGFERCLYLRRLERISMKRMVEVHQADVAEKKRVKDTQELAAAAKREAAGPWYKFW